MYGTVTKTNLPAMNKLLVVMMLALGLRLAAQERVDIEVVNTAPNQPCLVVLHPDQQGDQVLSNLVFTLKWKTGYRLALGRVLQSPIPLSAVGRPVISGRYTYQTYVGLGFDSVEFNRNQPIRILIDKQGVGKVVVATDYLVHQLAFNGGYYISAGGVDITGDVLDSEDSSQTNPANGATLYFDPITNQLLVERGGVFRTLLDQQVRVVDRTQLRLVR